MATLTFPVSADGLCVDVRVNFDTTTLNSLKSAGHPLPSSIPARGLIDTGSDISAAAPWILQQLAVPVHSQRTTHGIAGSIPVRLFNISLFILDSHQPQMPWLVQPDLLVMELPSTLPVDVLIGLDVLFNCSLLLDGLGRQFTLTF
jgi:hypothetical protein